MLSTALPPLCAAAASGLLAAAAEEPDNPADPQSPAPSGTPSNDVSLETVAESTISLLRLASHALVGALIGLAVALVVLIILRLLARRRGLYAEFARFCRRAAYTFGVLTGAYLGVQVALTSEGDNLMSTVILRLLLIGSIMGGTWLVTGMLKAVEASVVGGVRAAGDDGRTNRVTTQSQILRRVAQAVVVVCGLVGVVMTFPSARVAMGSLLASAGLVSVIAGLAAQSTLGNIFAGIQLATSDAIRVGDVVVVENEQGTIEEITLTYVVVHTWDDRRLVLPSTHFTENPFANWSRRGTQTTGTLTVDVDWRVPVSAVRAELARIVASSSVWDGRQASLDVIDASGGTVTLRIALSGANPSDVWALKCHVNEELVAWFQRQAPAALPRTRVEMEKVEVVHDTSPEQVARLAEELVALQRGDGAQAAITDGGSGSGAGGAGASGGAAGAPQGVGDPGTARIATTSDPIEAARLRAAAKGLSPLRRIGRERAARRRGLRPQEQGAGAQQQVQVQRPGRQDPTTVFTTAEMATAAPRQTAPAGVAPGSGAVASPGGGVPAAGAAPGDAGSTAPPSGSTAAMPLPGAAAPVAGASAGSPAGAVPGGATAAGVPGAGSPAGVPGAGSPAAAAPGSAAAAGRSAAVPSQGAQAAASPRGGTGAGGADAAEGRPRNGRRRR